MVKKRTAKSEKPTVNALDRNLEGWRCRHPKEVCFSDDVLRRAYRVCTECPTDRMVGVTDFPR
jgi:hypothetical protein